MTGPGDNRLTVLAAEIRDADGRFRRSAYEAASASIDAGNKLIEAKGLVPHGGWLPWLRDHVALSERSAQRFMRLASARLEIRHVADIGIRATDEALARPRLEHLHPPKGATVFCIRPVAGIEGERELTGYIWRSARAAAFYDLMVFPSPLKIGEVITLARPVTWDGMLETLRALNLADGTVDLHRHTVAAADECLRVLIGDAAPAVAA